MASDGSGSSSCIWSREDDKAFENALAMYSEDDTDRWEKISADVPGKSSEEIKHHYELLVEDIERIEKGLVPIPCYKSWSDGSENQMDDEGTGKKGGSESTRVGRSGRSRSDSDRRKGIPWTEEEHKLFLLGLDKFGKGDWRSISRNFVKSRTPTQVASHAQKYFNRLNATNKDRRRSSIHDITRVEGADVSVPQGPITGQTYGSSAGAVGGGGGSSGKSGKHSPQALGASLPAVGMYAGTTIGQPISGPLVPAVGTPLNLAQQGHIAFGMRAQVPGSVVPGAPVNMYPMGRPSAHR